MCARFCRSRSTTLPFSRQLIVTVEFASQNAGFNPSMLKEIRGDKEPGKPDGFAGAGELQVIARVCGHAIQRNPDVHGNHGKSFAIESGILEKRGRS